MGPRLDNRGWALAVPSQDTLARAASMGPRLDNRGWAVASGKYGTSPLELQWVHGWITVVGLGEFNCPPLAQRASMGPRLDNRGWASTAQ